MALRGADGSSVRLQPREGGKASQPQGDMVETKSSPRPVGPRPVAPPLNFASASAEPSKPTESFELSNGAPGAGSQTADAAPATFHEAEGDVSNEDAGRDDISVPPIGLDSAFFHETASHDHSLEVETRDPRAALKLTPAAAQRRAHLARYVTAAVGLAGVLCAAALVKVARGHEEAPRLTAVAHEVGVATKPELNAPATTEHATSSPTTAENSNNADKKEAVGDPSPAEQSAGSAVAETQGAAGATPPPAAQPVAAGETPAAAPSETASVQEAVEAPLDPKEAAKEAAKAKTQARGALEWGKMGDAITAGEKSVALDPTDAEAWLILGAAYQQRGDSKNAMRSFKACLDQGKRGPRNECSAMLR